MGIAVGRVLLAMIISERGLQVPLEQQLQIVRKLSEAVYFIPGGAIHGDIRPKNALFTGVAEGRSVYEGTVKLANFGLAKDVDVREMDQSHTNSIYTAARMGRSLDQRGTMHICKGGAGGRQDQQ
jgi:serine/threonine protein kinase